MRVTEPKAAYGAKRRPIEECIMLTLEVLLVRHMFPYLLRWFRKIQCTKWIPVVHMPG